jgi:hypothetical protein
VRKSRQKEMAVNKLYQNLLTLIDSGIYVGSAIDKG